ncbi:hypothetical protein ACFYWU_30530 [Streptomyces chrestomyceticus]|uniref:hypothetical protein n=1 Tax=Streptomyces chrestomyceticus TaxID=68185 RepID=UPI0036A51F0C
MTSTNGAADAPCAASRRPVAAPLARHRSPRIGYGSGRSRNASVHTTPASYACPGACARLRPGPVRQEQP